MARIAGLKDLGKEGEDEDKNKYYAGGNAQGGGGSGLNVIGPEGGAEDPYSGILSNAEPMSGGEEAERVITLYQGGFVVDDGPFRSFEDPANQQFIQQMNQGFVPQELQEPGSAGSVAVRIENKSSQEYVAPKGVKSFFGEGQSIGSKAAEAGAVVNASAASSEDSLEVDESKPTTTIALRLHTGKRIRLKLNATHRVGALVAAIKREGADGVSYVLQSGFPPAQITNYDQTLEEAGLTGAQITQTLKAE